MKQWPIYGTRRKRSIVPYRMIREILFLFVAIGFIHSFAGAQTPVSRYQEAKHQLESHSPSQDFLDDDSAAAVQALSDMWRASADAVVKLLVEQPGATTQQISLVLCKLDGPSADCKDGNGPAPDVIQLGPQLFAAALFSGEVGTVFIVGPRKGKPTLLWSIEDAAPQAMDPRGLLGAWKLDRAGGKCREANSEHKPGTCGPLYAALGLLTPDSNGHPRFYISAGYAQIMGATIGKQASVWRWAGDRADLLWIDWYDFMIDQRLGDHFKEDILSFGEKEEFRSFFACGSCEGRAVMQRLRITPDGVDNMGKQSTMPELDLIDELFWRLSEGKSTASIATLQVSQLLRPQIVDAKRESHKIEPNFFSVGMLDDFSVHRSAQGTKVCFTADGDVGRLYFTLHRDADGEMRITHVNQPTGQYGACPK
jgi:hypothetical protein